MSINISTLASDLAFIISDLPQTITYNGLTYNVVCDTLTEGRDLQLMGYEGNSLITVYCYAGDFQDKPKHNDVITYLSKEYKVDRVDIGADGVALILYCATKSR